MDIKTFSTTVRALPADVSVLIRGPHGIGKSYLAQGVADDVELPLIDRRLSQMSEGDLVGLPELVDGVTRTLVLVANRWFSSWTKSTVRLRSSNKVLSRSFWPVSLTVTVFTLTPASSRRSMLRQNTR